MAPAALGGPAWRLLETSQMRSTKLVPPSRAWEALGSRETPQILVLSLIQCGVYCHFLFSFTKPNRPEAGACAG